MNAVILAGGAGTRLREVVRDVPKPMAPVAGKPFLEYIVVQLRDWNIADLILATGYMGETIESHFGNGAKWGCRIRYSRERTPLGTGGALREALRLAGGDDVVAMNGDSFIDLDLDAFLAFHARHAGIGTVCLRRMDDLSRYGHADIDDAGRIVAFSEKTGAGNGLINGGVYAFRRRIADILPPGTISLEKTILPGLLGQGLYGCVTEGYFIDIGVPADYAEACSRPDRLRAGRAAGRPGP